MMIELRTINKRIYIKAPYELKDKLKALPTAKWEPEYRMWSFEATSSVAFHIEFFFLEPLQAETKTDEKYKELLDQAYKNAAATDRKTESGLPQPPIRNNDSWNHQLQAYHFAQEIPSTMFYMGMGTGKSKVVVDIVINNQYKRVLIIAPKSVLTVWPKEFKKHGGDYCPAVLPLTKGSVKKRKELTETFFNRADLIGRTKVIVANYESVWRPPFGPLTEVVNGKKKKINDGWLIEKGNFDLIVCDESHRIKAPGSKTSVYISKLGDTVEKRLCLTGTPMPNCPLDIYGQYRFLDKGIFGTSFVRFRSRYAITRPIGVNAQMVVGYQNQDELNAKIYQIAYKAGREVLDLPPAIHTTRDVELSPKTMKIYKELENDFYTWMEEKAQEVTITNALVKLLRLQQVCSGFVTTDEKEIIITGSEKQDVLIDTLEDLEPREPVVVFCRFRHDLESVHRAGLATKRTVAELSGSFNQLQEWQDAEYDILAVQIQAGGIGVDLTRACYCIYYSVGFSLGDYEQSLARVHRPGQDRTTFYTHIVAAGTVDAKVYEALDKKKKVVESILER